MSDALLLLRLEHKSMTKLLDLLEGQLVAMEFDEPENAVILKDLVDYFAEYLDQCHHPVENMLFQQMKKRDPQRAEDVQELLFEHAELAALMQRCRPDGGAQKSELVSLLRHFLALNRRHMDWEESHFFPAAEATLTRNDWSEVEYVLFDHDDPLVDQTAEARFRSIRKRLLENGDPNARRA